MIGPAQTGSVHSELIQVQHFLDRDWTNYHLFRTWPGLAWTNLDLSSTVSSFSVLYYSSGILVGEI